MYENKNVLVLVHANGKYDVNSAEHTQMVPVKKEFYETLVSEIRSGKYSKIIYFMNLPRCKTDSHIIDAFNKDPVLSQLTLDEIKKINIFFEGFDLSKEFDSLKKGLDLLDDLAQQGFNFIFGGLYYDICVQSYEQCMKNRNPGVQTFRPPYLSVASKQQSCLEMKSEEDTYDYEKKHYI